MSDKFISGDPTEFVGGDPRKKVDHSTGQVHVGNTTGIIKITGDVEKFPEDRIPEGWVQRAKGEWVPQWPECRYRRLNISISQKKPIEIIPVCLYNGKETGGRGEKVTHDFCCQCQLAQPHIPMVELTEQQSIDFEAGKFEDLPEEIRTGLTEGEKQLLQEDRKRMATNKDVLAQIKKDIDNIDDSSNGLPKDARLWWQPCIHREAVETDCCVKIFCRCDACPLLDMRITKKNCNDCEFRDNGGLVDIDQ